MKIGMQEITVEGIGTRVSVFLRGPTAVVRFFNSPDGFMDEPMAAELTLALAYLEQCAMIRVVILAGRDPGMFVRQYDVAVLHQRARPMRSRGKTFLLERPVPPGGIHRCLGDVLARALALPAALDAVPARALRQHQVSGWQRRVLDYVRRDGRRAHTLLRLHGGSCRRTTISMAMPWRAPMNIAVMSHLPRVSCRWCMAVMVMRTPVTPGGWPMDMAPTYGFTRPRGSPSSFSACRLATAKVSLTSK